MVKKTYGAEEARAMLPELLERARRGVRTVITKRGQPYAVLVPPGEGRVARAVSTLMSLRGTGPGLWGPNAAEFIAEVRDEWE